MAEHTPTPWIAATKYSSVAGVPIVGQSGKRIGNTALPDMPKEWDELKREAEANAAFIVKAVNNHMALVKALDQLDTLLDFGDENLDSVWTFDDLTAIQAAFNDAKAILDAVGGSRE